MAKKYLDYDGLLYFWQKIKALFVADVTYDSTNRKIQKTKNGSASDVVTLAKVATSGSYSDLSNTPTIPSAVQPSTTTPKMDGTASVGSEAKYARGDHVHPSDTSRVPTTRTVNGHALSSDVTIAVPDAISDLTNDMVYDLGTVSRGQFTITEAQRTAVATMWAKGLCAVTLTNDSETFYAIKERTVTYNGLDFYGFVGSYAGLSATGTPQTGICIVGICTTQNIGIFGAVDDLGQDDVETIISSYLPTAVSVTQKTTSGTNIADVTIGGTTTPLYAPTGGGGGITVLDCYPVGSYYETSDTSFDPNTVWGGTWVLDSKGRVTVSRDENITDFDTIGETGGEKTHTLTVNEMPSHSHYAYLAGGPIAIGTGRLSWEYNAAQEFGGSIGYTGGSQAHNNMPPYVVVNRWHRTA